MGREFGWLWTAYGVSALGTQFAFHAFPLIAVLVLHADTAAVSLLAAAGPLAGAVLAIPLGPWTERHRSRSVMITTDLLRCAALLSVPAAYALDWLSLTQLVLVSMLVAGADIAFAAASGAYLKGLVPQRDLLIANGRFEATTWTTTAVGPPLGALAIGLAGPVITVLADAVSFLLSALALRAIGHREPRPAAPARPRATDLTDGWRHILRDPLLRPLFANTLLVNSLIMATAPPMAVLMLRDLGFAPWQFSLAFALPCLGGLVGARLSRRVVASHGAHRVLRVFGTLRVCWPVALAALPPGPLGLALILTVQTGLVTCIGVFNPVFATTRLERIPADRVVRVLSAWSVSAKVAIAGLTALWGGASALAGPRAAIGLAGVLLLATPLLLPKEISRPACPATPR